MSEKSETPSLEQAKIVAPLFREAVRKAAEYGWSEECFALTARLVFVGYKLGEGAGISESQKTAQRTAARIPVDLMSGDWTPSAGFNGPARAIWVGVTGDLKVDIHGGAAAITLKNVPVGWLEVSVTKVYKTGTTASDLVAVS